MTIEDLKLNNWKDELGNLWNDPNSDEFIVYNKEDIIKGSEQSTFYFIPGWFIGSSEDTWKARYIKEYLGRYNRTIEEYYSRFILNLSEVPQCKAPGCKEKVLINGKISNGLNQYCCFEHQFIQGSPHNKELSNSISEAWENENSGYNSDHWHERRVESAREVMLDPSHQADLQFYRIHDQPIRIYHFYIALMEDNTIKIGVTSIYPIEGRMFLQDSFGRKPYYSIHKLFSANNKCIAWFEYDIKKEFNFSEYLEFSDFKKLKEKLRYYMLKYNIK
jgi:hypothetical protein